MLIWDTKTLTIRWPRVISEIHKRNSLHFEIFCRKRHRKFEITLIGNISKVFSLPI